MLTLRSLTGLAVRPSLWPTALITALRLAPTGWWRRAPYLPLPDPHYMQFRSVTAYGGDGTAEARPEDLVTYLRWCQAWPALTRRG